VSAHSDAVRAPEALLSIANCQAELKDTKGARKTMPISSRRTRSPRTAQAGRERLASLS